MSDSINRDHREAFQARLEFWISRTRLKPPRVRFRYMTRFWAVCRCDNSITFSTALLDQPVAFQDVVIVHELVHLRIPDHSEYFWRVLALYQPDWRTAGGLAPESPVKRKQTYRVEDCPERVSAKFPQGRVSNAGLTCTLPDSYRSRYARVTDPVCA
jgi:predicted metal-dependent hydrolase